MEVSPSGCNTDQCVFQSTHTFQELVRFGHESEKYLNFFYFCTLHSMRADKPACVPDPHCIRQYLYLVLFTQNNRIFLGSQIARFLSFRATSPPSCLQLSREEISLISHFTCHPVWGSVSLITSCPWASMQLCPRPSLIAFPLPSVFLPFISPSHGCEN